MGTVSATGSPHGEFWRGERKDFRVGGLRIAAELEMQGDPMKRRVFVVQPIPEVALDILRDVADVTVYPHLDRQISTDELVANAKRSDWLFVLGDTIVPAEVINANPELSGIGALSRTGGNIEMAWLGP